ncbi:hypothetical protein M1L60_04515 [Actinoplanes sp. TRM 88003]|uniref:Glycine zipper-like domain-containing protein n=1 Tax=Paractinoplanes aksuensis TaxID=2939490 RepID=A0ABT1DGA6_9ACTN|nr:hypothetical protein [Actinoplanes aksuensis]MCO8269854.1 hypothetical protein [Actinoplanes aksuensis]
MTNNNTPDGAAGSGLWANLGIWIAFGALFGTLAGLLFDNLALGVSLGSSLGVVAGVLFIARRNARG